MALLIYTLLAIFNLSGFIWKNPFFYLIARSIALIGAMFAFITLATGSIWGKPIWGTWWVWDARLTSELILFFLYMGYIALTSAIDDPRRADKAGGLLALVGAVNVPIIYFSVKWWNTLHQGASVSVTKGSSMAQTMLWAMLLMALACWAYTIAVVLYRVRSIILERERHTRWAQEVTA
jgi:heme exporter protein C